jgi:hypothetical protein
LSVLKQGDTVEFKIEGEKEKGYAAERGAAGA